MRLEPPFARAPAREDGRRWGFDRPAIFVLSATLGACAPATPPRPATPSQASKAGESVGSECPVARAVAWRGRFDAPDWLTKWDAEAKFIFGQGNVEIVSDPRFGSALRVHYPAGSSSSSFAKEGHPLGGAEFKARLPGGAESQSIFISYWVKFAPGFPWVLGGKLPGVCGGTCPTGGARVSGHDGWSVRTMWRGNGAGELYAYILPPEAYGTQLGLGAWTFSAGTWHRIAEELILNTDGRPDGISRVWYDADPSQKPTFEANGLTFRTDATPASTLLFSTFFGGHEAAWATPIDTYIDFAQFVVCR